MCIYFLVFYSFFQRPVLRHYYHNADAILFVVDSNDRDRMDMSREELTRLLSEDELSDCILLVLANKQDLASSMSASQVEEKLQLHQIAKDRNYCKGVHVLCCSKSLEVSYIYLLTTVVQGSCAVMGQGLYEGVDWLHGQLIQKAAKLSVSKPLAETKDAVGKSGLFSLVYSSLESYWPFNT